MPNQFQILLVEDDDNDVFLMKRAFKQHFIDANIQVTHNGHEAIEYLTGKGDFADRIKHPFPNLMITDLKMPKMSGIELLEWLREHKEYAVIPTIVLSSSHQETDVIRAYELGANSYLVKPSDVETLTRMVQLIRDYWAMTATPKQK